MHLVIAPGTSPVDWDISTHWERGADGHFRERATRRTAFWRVLNALSSSSALAPAYQAAVHALKGDLLIGRHVDRLIGSEHSASRIEADSVLWSIVYDMVDEKGALAFTDERFDQTWKELVSSFETDTLVVKTVAPIPYLSVATFPLQLNDELALDRLTEDEVTRCCEANLLRPITPTARVVSAQTAVGLRRTIWTRKLVREIDEQSRPVNIHDQGSFGRRGSFNDHLAIDDALSALRLFKEGTARTSGSASWVEFRWLGTGQSYRLMGQWPFIGSYELAEAEVPLFLELWRQLEAGAGSLSFPIHRFNLAFDRGLVEDRIVDLVIAAESLFLSDSDSQDRGELRFRFALRAAKFIKHSIYGERDLYRVMRRAYDARSSIVHGGSPKNTSLPNDAKASLHTFTNEIESLVRIALKKALGMREGGKELRRADYWEGLLFDARPGQD